MLISGFCCYIQSYLRDALGYSLLMLTYIIHDFDQGHILNTGRFFLWRFLECSLNLCMKETHNLHLLLSKCLVKWTCSIGIFTSMILSFGKCWHLYRIGADIPWMNWFANNHELFNTCVWTGMLIYKHLFWSASVSLACFVPLIYQPRVYHISFTMFS